MLLGYFGICQYSRRSNFTNQVSDHSQGFFILNFDGVLPEASVDSISTLVFLFVFMICLNENYAIIIWLVSVDYSEAAPCPPSLKIRAFERFDLVYWRFDIMPQASNANSPSEMIGQRSVQGFFKAFEVLIEMTVFFT